jgi:hypothetical protein
MSWTASSRPSERTFYKHESELIRRFLGAPEDIIESPTESQRVLFGRRVAACQ